MKTTHLQRQMLRLKHGDKSTNFLDFVGNGSLRNADGEDDELPCGGDREIPTETEEPEDTGQTTGSGTGQGTEQPEDTNPPTNYKKILWIGIVVIVIIVLFKD